MKHINNLPTGTVTCLFTDIEGSLQLWQKYPDQMHINMARRDAILCEAAEKRRNETED